MILLQEVVQQAVVQQPTHSHALVAVWALTAVALGEALVIWITVKARGGWTYIATIPFVNLRQLVSLILAVMTVIGSGVVGYLSGVWPPEYLVDSVLIAITVWMGIDVAQYWIKRKTSDPAFASTQNAMAAQQAAGMPVDARTAEMPLPATTPIPGAD